MENQIILTQKNCHRAARVRWIEHPEYGEYDFEWRGKRVDTNFLSCEYSHMASKPGYKEVFYISDIDNAMKSWEVLSWKYELNFENLWDLAVRAFSGTSHLPEKRAAQYIRDYEATLNEDLTKIPEDEQARYIDKFTDWVRTLFDKHSRCLSSMITGPARFPTQQNDKANNSYMAAVNEFGEWRERVKKAIARRIKDAKPIEQKIAEEWRRLQRSIYSSASTIKEINEGTGRGYNKALFVNSIYGKVETYAKRGDVEIVGKAIEYIRQLNEQTSVITERHKFFKLPELAETVRKAQEVRTNKVDMELAFEGGKIVKNFNENRLQIIFDGKPAPDVISNLKHNGFRWSPRFGAWQRQLTSNAYYAASRVIPITVEQLK